MRTFLSVARASMEDTSRLLDRVPYIYYLVYFKKNEIWALINFGSKVKTIIPAYIAQLGLKISKTNVDIKKIDDSILSILRTVLTNL